MGKNKDRNMSKQTNTEQKPVDESIPPTSDPKTEPLHGVPESESGTAEMTSTYGSTRIENGAVLHDPVKTIVESKPAPVAEQKPVVAKAPVPAPAVPLNVRKLNNLIAQYEAKLPLQSRSDKSRYDSIHAMIDLCNYLNRINDPAVYEAFFRYFQLNQDTKMYHQVALFGVHTIKNLRIKTRVSATHSCFLQLCEVKKSKVKLPYEYTVKALLAMEIAEPLANWLVRRTEIRN